MPNYWQTTRNLVKVSQKQREQHYSEILWQIFIHNNNGIVISHWQGEFKIEDKEEEDKEERFTFKGREANKNGKFVVLRTYFTMSEEITNHKQ